MVVKTGGPVNQREHKQADSVQPHRVPKFALITSLSQGDEEHDLQGV